MTDKIAEIREKIEVCWDPEEKEIALRLCSALEVAKDGYAAILRNVDASAYNIETHCEQMQAKINSILEGKDG